MIRALRDVMSDYRAATFASLAPSPIIVLVLLLPSLLLTFYVLDRLYFHPLRNIPGPLIRRLTSLPLLYSSYIGTEASVGADLHRRYGPVVLVAPDDVSIADADAINPIYVNKEGFTKIQQYRGFDLGGHETIFSTLDTAHRASRAKAVVGIFSTGKIRRQCEEGGAMLECLHDFTAALEWAREKAGSGGSRKVDVLSMSRYLAVDIATAYVFGRRYGGLAELKADGQKKMSASASVDAFVAVGRIFLIPEPIYGWVVDMLLKLSTDLTFQASEDSVDRYLAGILEDVADLGDTFQARLLSRAGLTPEETLSQCKDIFFAGIDGTGTNLATVLWHICRQPAVLSRLHNEVKSVDGEGYAVSQTKTPYLHAVIKEGLRISMATPTRLARVVPEAGWSFGGYHFPAGTQVGCSAYVLHHDPAVFEDPFAFRPERWLVETEGERYVDGSRMGRQRAAWMPFGAGTRQCIARNLAQEELTLAVRMIVASGVLDGARAVGEKITLIEWFNGVVAGGKVELDFSG